MRCNSNQSVNEYDIIPIEIEANDVPVSDWITPKIVSDIFENNYRHSGNTDKYFTECCSKFDNNQLLLSLFIKS